jgi:hypothetical protein
MQEADPLGAVGLFNCVVGREPMYNGREHVFKLNKYGKKMETHYFQGQSAEDVTMLVFSSLNWQQG